MFAAFVSLAVVFRKRSEAHKRLILLASMSIVGSALARLPRWPIFAGGLEAGRIYAIAGLLIMFAILLSYDVVTRKKPHPASWVGMVLILTSLAGAVFLGITGIGYHILHG
jgi:glucose dehydrogenase